MNYDHKAELENAKKELKEKYGEGIEKAYEKLDESEQVEENKAKNSIKLSSGEIVSFDFNYLTGKTILNFKSEFKRTSKRELPTIDELGDNYCTFIASKISNKNLKEIEALPYKDWAKVKNFVRDYLLNV